MHDIEPSPSEKDASSLAGTISEHRARKSFGELNNSIQERWPLLKSNTVL